MRATAAEETQSSALLLLCVAAWAIPGAGPLWLGKRPKGLILSDPLIALAAAADVGIGLTYFIASGLGYGGGDVRAVTYEYGHAFLIVAGLLNLLVVLDAYDVALGRK